MSIINRLREKWRFKDEQRRTAPPRIETPWGDTTESARRQAAANMAADPAVKRRVEEALAKREGSVAAGLAEARRRYPEAYQDDGSSAGEVA